MEFCGFIFHATEPNTLHYWKGLAKKDCEWFDRNLIPHYSYAYAWSLFITNYKISAPFQLWEEIMHYEARLVIMMNEGECVMYSVYIYNASKG